MAKRRQFGKIRQLPSKRYQASYVHEGQRFVAPTTFTRKGDASAWLSSIETEIRSGQWVDPSQARSIMLCDYIRDYLKSPTIGERWRETCERNLRLHLAPIATLPLGEITAPRVRSWYYEAMAGTGGKTSIAQSYRLLRAVFNQAMTDEIVTANPCRVDGAGADTASERPIATPEEVQDLADAINARYRAAVLLAAWCGLRRGEIVALHCEDLDLEAREVTVRHNQVEPLTGRQIILKDPKTKAGKRTVSIPPHIIADLQSHLDEFAGKTRVFVGRTGAPMRGDTLRQAFERARDVVGMSHFRFHDLRHTGQTLAAATGATLKDLMRRLGHASEAAAKRYLHAVDGRDVEIAKALSDIAKDGTAAKLPRRFR